MAWVWSAAGVSIRVGDCCEPSLASASRKRRGCRHGAEAFQRKKRFYSFWAKLPAPRAPVFAADIDARFVELARETALRARVEKHMTFFASSLQNLAPPAPRGLLVANLPYGERIGALPGLYRDVGFALRERFAGWRAALLVPASGPTASFGLGKPRKTIHLMNGALDVRLLLFDAKEP